MGEAGSCLLFRKEALPRMTKMRCYVSGQAQIASAVLPVNRLPREGEAQKQLSGLAYSLWEKELVVCYF